MTADHAKLRELVRSAYACRNAGSDVLRIECFWALVEAVEASLPKTEITEVWHVEWVHQDRPDAAREPKVSVFWTRTAADCEAQRLKESSLNRGQWSCIRVTGPHSQEVPA